MSEQEILDFCEAHGVAIDFRYETPGRLVISMRKRGFEITHAISQCLISSIKDFPLYLNMILCEMCRNLDDTQKLQPL